MKDKIIPTDKWSFSDDVASCFENMLQRSIPQYPQMRDLVLRVASEYHQDGKTIVDIGCSNGLSIKKFVDEFGEGSKYLLCDVSNPMLDICRDRYADLIEKGIMTVSNTDLRATIPDDGNVDIFLSILTLQFTPIEYRFNIIQRIYDALPDGGAFILVEKVIGNTPDIDKMYIKSYYDIKGENGYTQEQISAKRKSLEGVLVPLTAAWNMEALKNVGFRGVDCFWRCLNFAGWVAVK